MLVPRNLGCQIFLSQQIRGPKHWQLKKYFVSKQIWAQKLRVQRYLRSKKKFNNLQTILLYPPDTLFIPCRHPTDAFKTPYKHTQGNLQTHSSHPSDTIQTPSREKTLGAPLKHSGNILETCLTHWHTLETLWVIHETQLTDLASTPLNAPN